MSANPRPHPLRPGKPPKDGFPDEERLRDFAEAGAEWFWEQDAQLRFTYVSANVEPVSGFPARSLIGRTWRETRPAGVAAEAWAEHESILERHLPFRDFRFARMDASGQLRHLAISGKPVRDARGGFAGYRGVGRDITAQVEAEQRAHAAEQRLADALDTLSDGLVLFDDHDHAVLWNHRMVAINPALTSSLAGQTFADALGRALSEGQFRRPDQFSSNQAWIDHLVALRATGTADFELQTRDGRFIACRDRRTRDGGMIGIRSDVTELKRRECELAEREARATEAEQRLREAIESMPDGFVLRDAEGRMLLCNRRHLEIFGYAADADFASKTFQEVVTDLVARGFFDTSPQAQRERAVRHAGAGRDGLVVSEFRTSDGRVLDMHVHRTRDGGSVQVTGDVTADRAREHRLRRAEEVMRDAIEAMTDGFMLRDASGAAIMCNSRYLEILGFRSFEEIQRLDASGVRKLLQRRGYYAERIPEDGLEAWAEDRRASLARGSRRLEYETADGRTIRIRTRPTQSGGTVTVIADVSTDRRRERRMADAEALQRAAIETIDDGFSLWGRDDRLILWNRRLEQMFAADGATLREGLPFRDWVLAHIRAGFSDPGGLTPEAFADAKAIQHRAGGSREITFANGMTLLVRERELPDGGIVRIDTDITERKRQEMLLRSAKEAAEAANRSKSAFLASMSHELRTPLNAILGFSESMESQILGPLGRPRYVEYAHDIHKSGLLLLDLINDMLDMSRIEAGRFELHREPVRMDELAGDVLDIIRVQAEKASLTIMEEMPPDLPPVSLDPRAIRQVLLNLLSNAVKFSRPGGVIRLAADIPANMLRVRVIDAGVGISKSDMLRLGRPFERVGDVMTQPIQGTGLGLSISKRLIELHGGRLDIESELGLGTTVTVLLPSG